MGDTRADVAAMDELELLGVLASWLSGRPPDVPEGLPWGSMLSLAERHGVLALLHRAARASCWQRLGSEVREALLRGAGRAAAGAMLGDHHLSATLALLARQGIRPLVMKGAALAQTHYGDGALRPRCDVDLLIAPEDRAPVDELLTAAGFRRLNSVRGVHISHQSTYVQEQPQGFPHAYDIHWRPSNRNLFAGVQTYGELLGRSVPLPGLGPEARTLAPGDALMLACVHRLSHRAGGLRLIWAYDIHLLVQGLDAQELADFVERACSRGVVRVCQEAILEARHWLGTERPGLAEWLATPPAAPEPTAGALRPQGRIAGLLGELRALPTLRARARLIQEHLLPPADYLLERYRTRRRWLLPALYGWRLMRGLARAAMAPAPRARASGPGAERLDISGRNLLPPTRKGSQGSWVMTHRGSHRLVPESILTPIPHRSSSAIAAALREEAARGTVAFRVHGACMGDLLTPGSSVQVQARSRYCPGDVVVVRCAGRGFRVHRVIGAYPWRGGWRWLTQADAADRPDSAVPRSSIIGRVVASASRREAFRIPLRHRLWAAWRFLRFLGARINRGAYR